MSAVHPEGELRDSRGRAFADLRISLTDRCNFRCSYCMPAEQFGSGHVFLAQDEQLTFSEIGRIVAALLPLGLKKVRFTGGEPLLRRDIEQLIALVRGQADDLDLALTTNGSMLTPRRAASLVSAGLNRVTVSLDALDANIFAALNGVGYPVSRVLAGIDAAVAASLPVKVNMVVKRGANDQEILPMAGHFRHSGIRLRLIEFMDVGSTNGWRMDDVVTGDEMIARIGAVWPLLPLARTDASEVARNFRYADGAGEIGVIASVSHPFCSACSRLRLSSDGKVYTCLFAADGFDLKSRLRHGTDADLKQVLSDLWRLRSDRYSEVRGEQDQPDGQRAKVEMSRIGG